MSMSHDTLRSAARHDAALLAAAIEVHSILLDLDGERELDAEERLQMDASEATIRRLLPEWLWASKKAKENVR